MATKKTNRKLKSVSSAAKKRPGTSLLLLKLWRYIRLTMVTALVVVCVSAVGYYVTRTAQSLLQSPIAAVVVQGHFQYISQETVENLMQDVINKSFVSEDINQIQKTLQNHAWIDQVSLSRQWPDRLQVTLKEQVPIARWGNKGFVNNRGELIMTPDVEKLSGFAELDGNATEAAEVMQQYSAIAAQLRPHGYAVTRLQKNQRGVWRLQLSNGWEIILGKYEVLRKMHRIVALLAQEQIPDSNNIKIIDARYSNGIAVRWQENQKPHQEENIQEKSIAAINTRG